MHLLYNSGVQRYWLAGAKADLADPGQNEVPILTIALDTGFQSIGPFNRAFKAETGMTPSEFRLSGSRRHAEALPTERSPIPVSASGRPDSAIVPLESAR